jgi:hypothetical protein
MFSYDFTQTLLAATDMTFDRVERNIQDIRNVIVFEVLRKEERQHQSG